MEPAGHALEKVVASSLRRAAPGEAPLLAWPLACGPAVAERTEALDFCDGILRIQVPDAGWRSELKVLAANYLAVINRYSREPVKRIEFMLAVTKPQ